MLRIDGSLGRWGWMLLAALATTSCGGGGSDTPAVVSLQSIALSPLTVSLAPAATSQLTVTGTYSNATTQAIGSGETFASSDTAVATVSATGVVTAVAAGSATITATDTASGDSTAAAASTVVTVTAAATGAPTTASVNSASSTATTNAACTALEPFYWEIGDKTGLIASGSVGTDSTGAPVVATTQYSIASASKWIYGMYVVQVRGAATSLTTQDINFLHFTSGYTNMGTDTTSSTCPDTDDPDTVNQCLTLVNSTNNLAYSYQNPATTGEFDYDGGHLENHASQFTALGTLVGNAANNALATAVAAQLGAGVSLTYTQPLMAGGIYTDASTYATILRNVLSGSLFMLDALGIDPVCTNNGGDYSGTTCVAGASPIPENWHYSMAHWVEDDPSTNGDGAFSSPGAFGFYPWIEAGKQYYGIISRYEPPQTGGITQQGYASAECGRLIRHAWDTGTVQTGTIPN